MPRRVREKSLQCALVAAILLIGGCGGEAESDSQTASDSIATTAPSSNVLLAPLDTAGTTVRIGAMEPITQREGYDNQPAFTSDSRALLWTSIRDAQSDVYRRPVPTEGDSTARLTRTPESEYSPTLRPEGGLSVVRVEADGRQRLWHYSAQGTPIAPLLPDADSVGYHAWLDRTRVALFVLGDPPTLHVADVATGRDTVVASRIGRSLRPVPGTSAVSFVRVHQDSTTTLRRLEADGDAFRTERITATPGRGTRETRMDARRDAPYGRRPGAPSVASFRSGVARRRILRRRRGFAPRRVAVCQVASAGRWAVGTPRTRTSSTVIFLNEQEGVLCESGA